MPDWDAIVCALHSNYRQIDGVYKGVCQRRSNACGVDHIGIMGLNQAEACVAAGAAAQDGVHSGGSGAHSGAGGAQERAGRALPVALHRGGGRRGCSAVLEALAAARRETGRLHRRRSFCRACTAGSGSAQPGPVISGVCRSVRVFLQSLCRLRICTARPRHSWCRLLPEGQFLAVSAPAAVRTTGPLFLIVVEPL